MVHLFGKRQRDSEHHTDGTDFGYLNPKTYYFDSACQTLRPQSVIDAELRYYHTYNACGGRVKYPWGIQVDGEVKNVRTQLLRFAGKSGKDYDVVFTLNTTYGINLILHQLRSADFQKIVTSDIEHNSVFLPTMTWSSRTGKERVVLPRADDGTLIYKEGDLERAVVVLNSTSNIDGRTLRNAAQIATDVHRKGGLLLIDAAQTFGHDPSFLKDVDFDAAFGSGHKMYAPSMGFVIIKKELLRTLDPFFIGGGTVQDVQKDSFTLVQDTHELFARVEPGLQNWAGIIGLGAAMDFLEKDHDGANREKMLGTKLFDALKKIARVHLINASPSSIISFYVDDFDAHKLALFLGEQSIMCRSGYFCCHYYLLHLKKHPPLLRVSIGRNNTEEQVNDFLAALSAILHIL